MPRPDETTGAVRIPRVDGNAIAGALGEVFRSDVTVATAECGGCRVSRPLAEAIVELDDDGAIVLCRSCRHTLFSYVTNGAGTVLEIAGLRSLRIERTG